MLEKLNALCNNAARELNEADGIGALNDLRVKYLGKNGEITQLMKGLKDVAAEQKPLIGAELNKARTQIEEKINQALTLLKEKEKTERYRSERIDVTLSKKLYERGGLHPLTKVKNEIMDIFISLGFSVMDGREIETDYYNFEALNTPKDHPARDAQDTFYITENILLRTQTSTVQIHTMETRKPPIRIVCPGKVYRADDDATHSPMFGQIEGLVIDKNITLCDLKGILEEFAHSFFLPTTKTRLRPSFFPFTEPSVEVDLSCAICGGQGCRLCKNTGWIEILGAGMVNPKVLEMSGIDSSIYSGFAFGMGIERITMIKYGIPDMRLLFENDIRLLKQYR
jgi:phenylalanyl-tRNA synthetase alpha chain